jgi:hypothetical protein
LILLLPLLLLLLWLLLLRRRLRRLPTSWALWPCFVLRLVRAP